MKKYKWIVHPYSYAEKGSREVSVIHTSNFHGLDSCGWFGETKIFFVTDSVYGTVNDDVIEFAIKSAQEMADNLNKKGIGPTDDEIEKLEEDKKEKDERFLEFHNEIMEQVLDRMIESGSFDFPESAESDEDEKV